MQLRRSITTRKPLTALIAFVLALVLVPTSALAATVAKIGSTEYENLETAFSSAVDGDTIELVANVTISTQSHRYVSGSKTVTLLGHGHTISNLQSEPTFEVMEGGTLNLGSVDGTDTLTITGNTYGPATLLYVGEPTSTGTATDTLNMYAGVTLSDNYCTGTVAGVDVASHGVFNMYGGTITRCVSSSVISGAVLVGSPFGAGAFNMYGGTISYCEATNDAPSVGGVCVQYGDFNMSGGTIDNCKGQYAGAVLVFPTTSSSSSYANVNITGGTISNNSTTTSSGLAGGVAAYAYDGQYAQYKRDIKVTIENATITGNSAAYAGAVCTSSATSLLISNVTISGNTASTGAGGMYLSATPTTISGSTIAHNEGAYGGAIYVDSSAVTASSTIVTANSASLGGGVLLDDYSSFTMQAGSAVYYNSASTAADDFFATGANTTLTLLSAADVAKNAGDDSINGYFEDFAAGDEDYNRLTDDPTTTAGRFKDATSEKLPVRVTKLSFDDTYLCLKVAGLYTVTYTDGTEDGSYFADQVTTNLLFGTATPAFEGTPARTGYTFAGWDPELAATVTKDVTYVAQWTPNQYAITLDNALATTPGTATVYERYATGVYLDADESQAMTTSENPITIPERAYTVTYVANGGDAIASDTVSYTFDGYYDGQTQLIDGAGHITSAFASDRYVDAATLTARWSGGTLTLPKATRSGYVFEGWYLDEALTQAVTELTPTADVTVYAKWSLKTYTVTYDPAGGTWADGTTGAKKVTKPVTEGQTILDAPTRDGYVFVEWKSGSYQPGDAYAEKDDAGFYVDGELVAVWKPAQAKKVLPDMGDETSPTALLVLVGVGAIALAAGVARRRESE